MVQAGARQAAETEQTGLFTDTGSFKAKAKNGLHCGALTVSEVWVCQRAARLYINPTQRAEP